MNDTQEKLIQALQDIASDMSRSGFWAEDAETVREAAAELETLYKEAERETVRAEERERIAQIADNIEQEARAEAYRRFTGDTIVDETTGETVPFDDYGYAETEREGFIAGAVWAASRPASPATSEADECSCRGEYITALDLVDGCKCGRLKPFHEMTDDEVNVAASPVTRETVTEEMVRAGAYALDEAAMDSPEDYPLAYEQAMQQSRDVLEAALTEGETR